MLENKSDTKKINKEIVKETNKETNKKYIALKTCKVHCNGIFDLKEGQEIPKDIAKPFIQSLITNKTIK